MTNIYFIENAEGDIKIGRSEDVGKRLRQLQTGNSYRLKLKYVIPNVNETFEDHVHGICEAFHKQGEWFEKDALNHLLKHPFYKKEMIAYRQ